MSRPSCGGTVDFTDAACPPLNSSQTQDGPGRRALIALVGALSLQLARIIPW
jgi:hypothetical protein